MRPPWWSIFQRPAFRENARNPRSPVATWRFFLREISHRHLLSRHTAGTVNGKRTRVRGSPKQEP